MTSAKPRQKKEKFACMSKESAFAPAHHHSLHHRLPRAATMTTLWTFRGPVLLQTTFFSLRASPRPFAIVAQQAFTNKMHPLHQRTTEKFLARQTQLNIYTVVPLETSKHATVRDRIRRRLHEATRLALVDRGYKADGSPIQNKDKDGGEMWKEKLLGTLCFYPTFSVVSADWEELRKNVDLGIKKFMELKAKDRERERQTGFKMSVRDAEMNPRHPMRPPVEGEEKRWQGPKQRWDQGGQRQRQGGQRQGQGGQQRPDGQRKEGGYREERGGYREERGGYREERGGHREELGGPRRSPQHQQDRQHRQNKSSERPSRATFSGGHGMV
jgi:hypothetical protein